MLKPGAILTMGGVMKKSLLTASLVAGSLAFGSAVGVAQQVPKLPPSGTTHFTTYFSVHPAHVVEMVDDSSITVAELVGITVNPDGEPHFDNMVVRCLVTIRVVKGEQDLYGACKETDKDGDYTSTTFDSKAHYFIGGTGKYKGITGEAPFTVEALPSPGDDPRRADHPARGHLEARVSTPPPRSAAASQRPGRPRLAAQRRAAV